RDLVGGLAHQLLAHETDRTAAGRDQADDRLAQRRLAHAVASDEGKHAALELQIHALQGMAAAVKNVEALDLQKVCGTTLSHGHSPDTIAAPPGPPRSRAAHPP